MAAHAMPLSDEQLIAEYQSADPALAAGLHANELFSRYSKRVTVWCLRFAGGDREMARDLSQECPGGHHARRLARRARAWQLTP